jgi:hypothetical protein
MDNPNGVASGSEFAFGWVVDREVFLRRNLSCTTSTTKPRPVPLRFPDGDREWELRSTPESRPAAPVAMLS